jgi:hypothetical protein
MKILKFTLAVSSALALFTLTGGCDRTVSKKESTTVGSDGSVRSKETTVTEKADGTTVKKEESSKTTPSKP